MSNKKLQSLYPLHFLVWYNNYDELDKELAKDVHDKETLDPRGRTALHLSVTLGHVECTKVLLRFGANASAENVGYWSAVHESVASGDPELLQVVLKYRDYQRYNKRTVGVPELLQKLKESPDFYVEMKWEFTSWVPLMSRMCPSDTYKVWKSGANVRIDTTLLGFDNMTWQRGSRSYIFKGSENSAVVMEVDHDRHEVSLDTMQIQAVPLDTSLMQPSDDAIAARLTSPIVTTYIDTEKIAFERNKSGIWGWRSDRAEVINNYDTKVFSASNVELVTKTRVEHLTEQEKIKARKNSRTPLETFLGVAEEHSKITGACNGDVSSQTKNPSCISPEEYFDKDIDLQGRDIGRPIEQSTKTQKFKATLWLCEDFPLSLQEQVVPIIDLMAASNAHFRKLKDFITLQLPAGFPVKIEIPLFHVLNGRVTFGNICGGDQAIEGVNLIEDDKKMYCVLDESVFNAPTSYRTLGDGHHERLRDEDDELLQFAIQQSLVEAGTENDQVTFWEALNKTKPPPSMMRAAEEERLLQRAIEESIAASAGRDSSNIPEYIQSESISNFIPVDDDQLEIALDLSRREQENSDKRRHDEEAELEMILKLSLTEK
ncbi:hypothetical protein ScPMuIL_006620 [Solemya velum]